MTENPKRPVHTFPMRTAIEQDPALARSLIAAGFDPHTWGSHDPAPSSGALPPVAEDARYHRWRKHAPGSDPFGNAK